MKSNTETWFTPGPWSPYEDEWWRIRGADVASDMDVCAVTAPEDWPVGATAEGHEAAQAECEANARLIAAAPDLYAALERAAKHACSMLCSSVKKTGAEWVHVAECEANASALAKARGDSLVAGEERG